MVNKQESNSVSADLKRALLDLQRALMTEYPPTTNRDEALRLIQNILNGDSDALPRLMAWLDARQAEQARRTPARRAMAV